MHTFKYVYTCLALAVLATALCGGCGTAGSTLSPPSRVSPAPTPAVSPTPVVSPTPAVQSVSTTIPLAAAGVQMPIPTIDFDGGYSIVPTHSAQPGTTVTITVYHNKTRRAPRGAPQATMPAGETAFLWITYTYSNPVSFTAFPTTHYQIDGDAITCSAVQETFDAATGTLLAKQDASNVHTPDIGDFLIDFASLPSAFGVIPGHTYWVEVGSGSGGFLC